ncbi:hypothetical protein G6702_06785 [Polynucleobacter paneuropaeus]|nr:hypothetical protein G6702_06785 [Polynucleobacter paneuropaeus]
MTEVESHIELCFGLPSTEKCEKNVNDICIRYGYTYEEVRNIEFRTMFETLMKFPNDNGHSFVEILFSTFVKENVTGPVVSIGTYVCHGNNYSKLVIHGEYLFIVGSEEKILISDDMIHKLGENLESLFEFEYVESRKIKE